MSEEEQVERVVFTTDRLAFKFVTDPATGELVRLDDGQGNIVRDDPRKREARHVPPCDRPTRRFLARYWWEGAWWATDVYAYDWDDAAVRCLVLGMTLDGEWTGDR